MCSGGNLESTSMIRHTPAVLGIALVLAAGLTGCGKQNSAQADLAPAAQSPITQEASMTRPKSPHHLPPADVHGVGPSKRYDQAAGAMDFSFEYPGNWALGVEEGRRQPYRQAIILGPRNVKDTFSAALVIRRLPSKSAGGSFETLQELMEHRRKQYQGREQFSVTGEDTPPLLGTTAHRMQFGYLTTPPQARNQMQALVTRVRAIAVWLTIGDRLYELTYEADVDDFPAYLPVFDRLLQSLQPAA
jgi:hypothetical protein